MIKSLSLWSNFSKLREVMAIMGQPEWNEVQSFFSSAIEERDEEEAPYLEFVFGYINNYYEQGLLN